MGNNVDYARNESEIVSELNLLRSDPKSYAAKIRKYIPYFRKDNVLDIPGGDVIGTREGASAYEEAAVFLDSAEPCPKFQLNEGLTAIALDYYNTISTMQNKTNVAINIEKFIEDNGELEGRLAQSVDYGSYVPEFVVIQLLVDDGQLSRPNRGTLLDPKFLSIGVSAGPDCTEYQHCTVIMYAYLYKANAIALKKARTLEARKLNLQNVRCSEDIKDLIDEEFDENLEYVKVIKREKEIMRSGIPMKLTRIKSYKQNGLIDTDLFLEKL